jgi:hypothetical protein
VPSEDWWHYAGPMRYEKWENANNYSRMKMKRFRLRSYYNLEGTNQNGDKGARAWSRLLHLQVVVTENITKAISGFYDWQRYADANDAILIIVNSTSYSFCVRRKSLRNVSVSVV